MGTIQVQISCVADASASAEAFAAGRAKSPANLCGESCCAATRRRNGAVRCKPLPYDSQRQGVPVTRFTAAPGVLVRRGYDVASGEDAAAMQSGEVGVVQPSRGLGDTCVVEWASGRQAEYDTGRGNRFQLVHLEMSLTSGAPVVGDIAGDRRAGEGGSEQDWELHGWAQTALTYARTNEMDVRLERGTHWIGPTEGDWKGRAMLPRLSSPEGTVEIWHDDVKCLPASPTAGYSACYSASTAGPFPLVTLYAARQGMSMTFGWLAVSERNRRRGTLMRPVEVREDGVVWLMDLQWLLGYPHVKRQVRLLALPVAAGLLPQPGFYDSLHHWSDPVWSDQLYADE